MRFLSVLIVTPWLLLSQSWAAGTTNIATFGDSLFAGYGLPPEESFPVKLEKKLIAGGYNVKLQNQSVSGDTTTGGLARLAYVLAQQPNIVILELGGNDLLRAFPPATTHTNLEAMIVKLQGSGARVLLVGQQAPLNFGQKFADDYNAIFPALAAKYKLPLYPSVLQGVYGQPGLMQADAIHPTGAGVDVMVAGIAPLVEAMLNE